MNVSIWALGVIGLTVAASGLRPPPPPLTFPKQNSRLVGEIPQNVKYNTYFYQTRIDKFGYSRQDKFSMRYLVNDDFWQSDNSPILFYAGNEGDITGFANNTGVMYEMALDLGALVVFAEHRYYGQSQIDANANYDYLSAEYALADYAEFLVWLKSESQWEGASQSPVVVFGGSYGGMLAAWMRIKYPWLVIGAWAASAPVAWFQNLTNCNAFDEKTTGDFAAANLACPVNIRRSWSVIDQLGQTEEGLKELSEIFNLCSPLESADDLTAKLNEAWVYTAMVDYPYPTSFLQVLPAWPIDVMCSYLNTTDLTDRQLLTQIAAAANVYYDYPGTQSCFNISQGEIGVDTDVWFFQACTEMIQPMCSHPETSMFPPREWHGKKFAAYCEFYFRDVGSTWRPKWVINEFGARQLQAASNIIFSNGELDPWAAGGVHDNLGNPSLHIIKIEYAAHHLDLRASHPSDPWPVTKARQYEIHIVTQWIQEYNRRVLNRTHV